ncbi:hypothetical protein DFP72DRAFT_1062398 [Ephemerocybe angulata]|uniref:Tc1-like transposase DDE domain-containing protein n=1 Tax=Ephemerocybe angulata TaxID=980116 RepID=A0A8H6MAR2_9AGAR|nr:hypothetical protein DFP72DRAFT_1062398 [Tulosesus angulatus]
MTLAQHSEGLEDLNDDGHDEIEGDSAISTPNPPIPYTLPHQNRNRKHAAAHEMGRQVCENVPETPLMLLALPPTPHTTTGTATAGGDSSSGVTLDTHPSSRASKANPSCTAEGEKKSSTFAHIEPLVISVLSAPTFVNTPLKAHTARCRRVLHLLQGCVPRLSILIFEGSVNKEKVIRFVEQDLAPLLNPFPGPRSIIVLDNCTIHHDDEVKTHR